MVQRATSGEVNKQRKTDMDPSRMEAVNVWLNMVLEREHRIANGTYSRLLSLTETQVIQQTRQTLRGIRLIRFYLNEIYQECQRAGAVSLAFADLLRCCCGSDADIILSSISLDAPNPPEQIAELLKRLEREDFSLQARANSLAEKAAVDALRFSVPERADLFIRYDRHYSNELYRALAELERQQRRRSGEVVPPPIKVDMMAGG